ncbi:hypothetical protein PFISCL1PPCAC_7226, partial [Pristionchus fissidentatus]
MDNWRKQFSDFAGTDRIGKVMLETSNLLQEMAANPVSVADLEFGADAVSTMRANIQKHDGTQAPLSFEDLRRAYDEMRKCCY